MRRAGFSIALLLAALFFAGCPQPEPPPDDSVLRKPLEELTPEDMERMGAVIETNLGAFHLRFFPREAPATVLNFIRLVRTGFYDGIKFHRIIPLLNIHAGDPTGTGEGGPGWTIPAEINSHPHVRGAVGMYHPPYYYDQGGSQFYVMIARDRKLDTSYTVFGEVWKGMDTVDRIAGLPLNAPPGQAGEPRSPVLLQKARLEMLPASAGSKP